MIQSLPEGTRVLRLLFDLSLPSKRLTYVTYGSGVQTAKNRPWLNISLPCLFLLVILSSCSCWRHITGPVFSTVLLPSAQITENRRLWWQNNSEFAWSQITQSCLEAILVLLLKLRESVMQLMSNLLCYNPAYLTSAATGISSFTVFTSDSFCLSWTRCPLGPRKQDDWAIRSSQTSPPQPSHCFSAVQLWKRERYVLISHSFQEKYIPERSFHVCHITKEKVSPPRSWQAARPPRHTAQTRARGTGWGTACSLHSARIFAHVYNSPQSFFLSLFLGNHTPAERTWRCKKDMRTCSVTCVNHGVFIITWILRRQRPPRQRVSPCSP